jgi:hypothetical protein
MSQQYIEILNCGRIPIISILTDGDQDIQRSGAHTFLFPTAQGTVLVRCPVQFVLKYDSNIFYAAGQGLAMFEMTLTLATLFLRYDLSLEPGFTMEYLPSLL